MDDDSTGSGGRSAEDHLRRLAEELPAGSSLPSTRTLQSRFAISALTAQRVLAELSRSGVVLVVPGRGSYVAERRTTARPDLSWQTEVLGSRPEVLVANNVALLAPLPAGVVDLRLGYLDHALQPDRLLASAVTRAARRPHIWDRAPTEGLTELRALLAGAVAPRFSADDVLITSGGQAALSLAFRALAQPGDTVVFEHLTYPGAVAAARAAGLVVAPVRADHDGILPDALDDVLRRTQARLVYLQPRYSNPTGANLAHDRRQPVLDLLRAHDAFCIEDDYVQPLVLSGSPAATLAELDDTGHVVHVQSLTKPVAPGLRIAAVTSAGAATNRLRRYRVIDDLFVASVMQQTALELLTSPGWTRHLVATRRELASRRDTLLASLRAATPHAEAITPPSGGLSMWWPLPATTDEAAVVAAAQEAGVAVGAGSAYTLGEPPGPALRLTFGRCPTAVIGEAGTVIARVVEQAA